MNISVNVNRQILDIADQAYLTTQNQGHAKRLSNKYNIPLEVAEDALYEGYDFVKKKPQNTEAQAIANILKKAQFTILNYIKKMSKSCEFDINKFDSPIEDIPDASFLVNIDLANLTEEQSKFADNLIRELYSKQNLPQHQKAIVLGKALGFSYEEMAEILEKPLGSIKSSLHYIRH